MREKVPLGYSICEKIGVLEAVFVCMGTKGLHNFKKREIFVPYGMNFLHRYNWAKNHQANRHAMSTDLPRRQ